MKPYPYTRKKVRKKGRKDGRNWRWKLWPFLKEPVEPYPLVDQKEPPAFQNELLKMGEDLIADIAEKWKEADRDLKPAYCRSLAELANAQVQMEKDEKEIMPAKKKMDIAYEKLQELPVPEKSVKWELAWMIFFALVELPLNAIVFSIMGASKFETYIMALVIGLGIPLAAYLTGNLLKREPKQPITIFGIIGLMITVSCVIFGLAIFRTALFNTMQQHAILKIDISPVAASFGFVFINMLVFMIATVISHMSAHKDPATYKKRRAQYEDTREKYEEEVEDLDESTADFERKEALFQQLKQKRKKKFESLIAEAIDIRETFEWLIEVYRTANMEARDDGIKPECFKKEPKIIQLPPILQEANLDWDCRNTETFMHDSFGNNLNPN
jgi:hypothetical protein